MITGRMRQFSLVLGGALCVLVSACAPSVRFHQQVNNQRAHRNHDGALKTFQENRKNYGKAERLLAIYEEGALLYYAKRFPEALKVFEQADILGEELYTTSVTRTLATGIVNDTMSEYSGEDFERVMVNIFKALIYAEMGNTESALVEARRVDEKLALYNTKYEESQNVYTEDAFGRFITGILYLHSGTSEDLQDAGVAFRKAFEIYGGDYQKHYRSAVPKQLAVLAGEAAFLSGDELPDGAVPPPEGLTPQDFGDVVVIHLNGLVPEKVEKSWIIPTPDGHVIKVAYPEYRRRQYFNKGSVIRATRIGEGDGLPYEIASAATEEAQPLGDIARKNLEDRLGRIKAKAVARALAKYAATKATEEAIKRSRGNDPNAQLIGSLVGLAMNVAAVATENADTRHWGFLPDQIRIARLRLAPGRYELSAQLSVGKMVPIGEVEVQAGKAAVVSFDTVD
ncbi:MAG: hypothetical protein KIT79_02475 [Deltaproteobacteria bacterium]|nr:hypothetical protein [Deltaproteobacteria bacterium]